MVRFLIVFLALVLSSGGCNDAGKQASQSAASRGSASPGEKQPKLYSVPGPAFAPSEITFLQSVTTPGLINPMRVALGAEGTIAVSDPKAKAIFVFSPAGTLIERINVQVRPLGFAVDGEGRYIVGDADGSHIVVMSPSGAMPRLFCTGAGAFKKPNDMVIEPISGTVWIVDSGHDRVVACTAEGIFVRSFGSPGTGPAEFAFPVGIALDPAAGELYVTDLGNGRVQVFDTFGVYQRTVASYGGGDGQLTRPAGVALDHLNRLFVADLFQSKIQGFDPVGGSLQWIGTPGDQPGQLLLPSDIVVDQYHRLIVVSQGTRRIEIIGLDGHTAPPDPTAVLTVNAALDQPQIQFGPSIAPSYLCLDVPGSASEIVASSVRVFGFIPYEAGALDKNAKCDGAYYEAGGKILLGEVFKTNTAGGVREIAVTGRLRDGKTFAGAVRVNLMGGAQ